MEAKARVLGRADLAVSPVGLGLAALGRPGYINLGHAADLEGDYDLTRMEAHAHAVLDAAWEAGVRYFDAARSYGRAEAFLAGWLAKRRIAPGAVTVGSKWGYTYTAGWQAQAERHEVKDHSLSTLLRQSAESREILGPYLGLYQIHSATPESGVLEDRAVLEELARLRGQGWKVGLTVTGPRQGETVRRALGVTVAGEQLFDCVQATWNLLEPSAGPALEEEASRFGVSLDALALAAVLARPWVDVVLSGAAAVDQLRSNPAALAVPWDQRVSEMADSLAESPEDYWHTRGRLPWN